MIAAHPHARTAASISSSVCPQSESSTTTSICSSSDLCLRVPRRSLGRSRTFLRTDFVLGQFLGQLRPCDSAAVCPILLRRRCAERQRESARSDADSSTAVDSGSGGRASTTYASRILGRAWRHLALGAVPALQRNPLRFRASCERWRRIWGTPSYRAEGGRTGDHRR